MEEERARVIPISIQPKYVFGLRADVIGNIHFTQKQEVIYPVAGVLALQDYKTNKQKFLRFPGESYPEVIVLSLNRKLLAIAEISTTSSYINIYDAVTLKKRKTLFLPQDCPSKEIGNMSFTYDSKGLAVLSKEPDAFLTIFFFDKNETVISGRASHLNQRGRTKLLSCNPHDSGLVAVAGSNLLKLMTKSEKGFVQVSIPKCDELIITALTWINGEVLVAGTNDTMLYFIEAGEIKATFNATEVDIIDLSIISEEEEVPQEVDEYSKPKQMIDVNCLTSFQKGFAYAVHNVTYIFERETIMRFMKKTIITIPISIYANNLYKINNIAINAQQDTILASTVHSQIYIGMLFVPETLKVKELEFKTLGEPLHIDGILCIAVCPWKPIILTASSDQTIRIWNYVTGKIELVKKYQVDISIVNLHPSGIFAAVGFSDQLRIMEILLDDLKITKTFNFPKCQQVVFCHQGHMLACAYDNMVKIVSVFQFHEICVLKGHNGTVVSLTWSFCDQFLISSGLEGAVYEWSVNVAERVNEVVQKGIEYRHTEITQDRSAIYTVTNNGLLRVLANSEIIREIKPPDSTPLTCIALARSDLVMFIGSEKGHLYNVQLPLMDAGGGNCTNFRFFHNKITTMKITFCDRYLATASSDGTLVIWTILNNEGKIAEMDNELGKCVDVMIPRTDLIDKIETIQSLELRIGQQIAEFQYQLRQGDVFHSEQMRDIHKGYCDAITDLKEQNENLEASHIEEFNIITANIAQTKDDHDHMLMDLEAQFHEKIILEYEKSAKIKAQMDDMREDYENKLRKSAGCLQDTIEALETDFKKQLTERQDLIRGLMKLMEEKKLEFIEYCQQVNIDNDRNIVETQLRYEKLLKEEKQLTIKWRSSSGLLENKYTTMSKLCDDLNEEIQTLRIEHSKFQKKIRNAQKDINILNKDVEERNVTIRDKEKRVHELQQKNQELEKYKQVLQHKINELKSQIEPREREIKEKKDQIADMEKELEALQHGNNQLELQLSELKDKYHGVKIDLKIEKERNCAARSQINKICGDIYVVSGNLQKPDQLKTGVQNLFHRYSNDAELRKSLALDAEVQNEFMRQREHLEILLAKEQLNKGTKNEHTQDAKKLLNENVLLITELNRLRAEFKELLKNTLHMESILGLSGKYMPTRLAKEKLNKAVADFDELERNHKEDIDRLNEVIEALTEENKELRSKIIQLEK